MSSNGWKYTLDFQYVRPDMKLNHYEMRSMADDLDAMRQSVNLHDTGAMPGTIYHHIEQAEKAVLIHLFGKHGADIIGWVVDSGESIDYILKYERRNAEVFAYRDAENMVTFPEGCTLCRKIGHSFSESCWD